MNGSDTDGMDREGIGMLYAGGAGAMVASSVVYATTEPIIGWAVGICAIYLGLWYERYQRYLHTNTDRSEQ